MYSKRRHAAIIILISLFLSAGSVCVPAQDAATIFNVHRGINLAAPFARTTTTGPFGIKGQLSAYDGLHRYFPPKVITQLATVGVQLVRMPVNPVPLLENRDEAQDALLDELVQATVELNAAGIVVVLDLHFWSPADKFWTEEAMLDSPTGPGFTAFRTIIGQIAKKLATPRHGAVALELLNEPQACRHSSDESWFAFLRQLVADVRIISTDLPIVVTGCGGQLDGLIALRNFPFSDENMIYTFHFYEPFVFTHQTVEQYYPLIRHLPYPSSSGSLDDVLLSVVAAAEERGAAGSAIGMLAREKAKAEVRRYFNANTDISYVLKRFDEVGGWARQKGVPSSRILLGEFAALATPPNTTESDYASQLRWVGDVRRAAEMRGFSFAYWLYSDSRGPLIDPTHLTLHPSLGPALGLSAPAPLDLRH